MITKKRFISVIFICLLITIISLAYYFRQKSKLVTLKREENTIRIWYVNQWKGFSLINLTMINEILHERFEKIIYDPENYDLIIDGVFGKEKIKNTNSIKLFFTGEAIKPKYENYDLSIGFDYIDDPKYLRIPLYYFYFPMQTNTNYNRGKCNPDKMFFACFLYSSTTKKQKQKFDGYKEREEFFDKLSAYKKIHSGGKLKNNIGYVVPNDQRSTLAWLSNCKFIIAYENQSYEGYVTEKPFQAYIAGGIPIYYGHNSYINDVNPDSVIFAKNFKNNEELVDYIRKLDNDDDLYCKTWNQPMMTRKEQNYEEVKNKLRDKLYKLFDEKL